MVISVTALRSLANSEFPIISYVSPLDTFTLGTINYLYVPYLCAKLSMAALAVGFSV